MQQEVPQMQSGASLEKGGTGGISTHRKEGDVPVEAEMGVRRPPVQDCGQSQELEEIREGFCPGAPGGSTAPRCLGFLAAWPPKL